MKRSNDLAKWSVLTQNQPNIVERGRVRIEHSIGPLEEITTTTTTETPTTVEREKDIQIFVVAVNEQKFYKEQFDNLYSDIKGVINLDIYPNCEISRTIAKSCSLECSMTDDPDRGCLAFTVGLVQSDVCTYKYDQFKSDLEDR